MLACSAAAIAGALARVVLLDPAAFVGRATIPCDRTTHGTIDERVASPKQQQQSAMRKDTAITAPMHSELGVVEWTTAIVEHADGSVECIATPIYSAGGETVFPTCETIETMEVLDVEESLARKDVRFVARGVIGETNGLSDVVTESAQDGTGRWQDRDQDQLGHPQASEPISGSDLTIASSPEALDWTGQGCASRFGLQQALRALILPTAL